jgi:RNA polymerase sigma-70 factor (ECF subfamily)
MDAGLGGHTVVEGSAADEFCRELWRPLASTMGLLCGSKSVGEEIAQEALARAWARWSYVSRLDSPEGWAYRVAINISRSQHRRIGAERRALARTQEAEKQPPPDPADAIAVRQAVAALPERQRAAVVLRYLLDLPVAEVAEIMRCAPGTVKSLTSQAIERLRVDFVLEEPKEAAVD